VNQERLLNILKAPLVTEKSMNLDRQYVFKVAKDANKHEISQAVATVFNVVVEHVRVSNVKARAKRFGQTLGHRKAWKKAYVKLAEGSEIQMAGAES
jgi:large subunit ribosomal protein L23